MLDSDLAEMYQVETKVLNQAVKRNLDRFPDSFRFQLTGKEIQNLRSQSVTSSGEHGGRRFLHEAPKAGVPDNLIGINFPSNLIHKKSSI